LLSEIPGGGEVGEIEQSLRPPREKEYFTLTMDEPTRAYTLPPQLFMPSSAIVFLQKNLIYTHFWSFVMTKYTS